MKRIYGKIVFITIFCLTVQSLSASENPVDIHGFISQGFMKTSQNNYVADSEDGSFQFSEMGINFFHQPMDRLSLGIQFFARDFGEVENDKIRLDYAYADYNALDFVGIRAGRMKNPMGIYSETRDIDLLRTCVFLPFSVYDELLRDSQTYIQGVGIYGNFIIGKWGTIRYQALVGENNIDVDSATGNYLTDNRLVAETIEMHTTYSYSLQYWAPKRRFGIGGTALFSNLTLEGLFGNYGYSSDYGLTEGTPLILDADNLEVYTASLLFAWLNIAFSYELKYTKARNMVFRDPTTTNEYVVPVTQLGYYCMISYAVTDRFAVNIYYDVFYPFEKDRSGHHPIPGQRRDDHWLKRWAFSCKFDINPNWQLKFETDYNDGTASLLDKYNEEERHQYWWLSAAKISYNF